ncbi:hypothetical protein PILCRDRAFT_11810 [Piloderma croceum F 1598]|uniref:Uncharacterized protein n=1 Tax=Piloderma croceum (strain F 1598) TaxID=765440 RepID=A0A0C3BK54_PILCF|nr:hypothetical protein PILCRDRAFT_11810 [Piloderma croceum F 1598]
MASQAIPLSNSDEPGSDPGGSLVLTADIEELGLVASSTSTHPTKETAVFLQDIVSNIISFVPVTPAAIAHLEESLAATKVEPEYAFRSRSTQHPSPGTNSAPANSSSSPPLTGKSTPSTLPVLTSSGAAF